MLSKNQDSKGVSKCFLRKYVINNYSSTTIPTGSRIQCIRSARLQLIMLDEDIVCPYMKVYEVHKRTG